MGNETQCMGARISLANDHIPEPESFARRHHLHNAPIPMATHRTSYLQQPSPVSRPFLFLFLILDPAHHRLGDVRFTGRARSSTGPGDSRTQGVRDYWKSASSILPTRCSEAALHPKNDQFREAVAPVAHCPILRGCRCSYPRLRSECRRERRDWSVPPTYRSIAPNDQFLRS